MKTTLLLVLMLLLGTPIAFCQETKKQYEGKTEVPDLGTVEFPPGKWQLEFRVPPPNPNPAHRPDYFGFRKIGEPIERLGFRHYTPDIAPDQLVHLCDGITEELGRGAPSKFTGPETSDVKIIPMNFEPPLSEIKAGTKDICFSFITVVARNSQNWICHAHLYSGSDGGAYVLFHASTAVLDPETVWSLMWPSQDRTK